MLALHLARMHVHLQGRLMPALPPGMGNPPWRAPSRCQISLNTSGRRTVRPIADSEDYQ